MEKSGLFAVAEILRNGGTIELPSLEDYELHFLLAHQRQIAEAQRDHTDERFHRAVMSFVNTETK